MGPVASPDAKDTLNQELGERPQAPGPAATTGAGRTLAVDAGQTGTRAALVVAGRLAGPAGHGPGVQHLTSPAGIEHAVEGIRAAADRAGVARGGIGMVCLGLSGFADAAPQVERLAEALADRLGAERVAIASDVVTSYLGALGARPGVVVAAGTGSVALAADGRGAVALVDGWGHLLGDAGSGFAIGRAGLESALRAADGRGGSDALRVRAEAAFGRLDELPAVIYGDERPAQRVAAFARAVADAARAGDDTARALWALAACELARTATAAAERALGAAVPADVSWAGGLFAAEDLLRAPFARRLAERAPRLRLVAPGGTALDGARLLATPEAGRIFPGRIWTSDGSARP
jgi:N-acetylglucosamine kinase-like BadF-type ATPase